MNPALYLDRTQLEEILEASQEASAEFLASLESRPVAQPPSAPETFRLAEKGVGALEALELFRRRYEAGLSGSAGPRYLGFVTGGSTPAALAGDWLATAYDQNLSNDGDSLATSVERETLGLLLDLFHLPESFDGAFVSGATQSNAVALATARQWALRRLGVDAAEEGLWGAEPIPVFGGTPHASVYKALSSLGMGRKVVEVVPCLPGRRAVDPEALAARLEAREGKPSIVVASAGEVNTGDFDDLEALTGLCRRHGAWLHVDGAFGLFAACDPQRASWLRGLEEADSITVDAHKWLNVPYDSGVILTRHGKEQEEVFKAVASYLGAGPDLLHRTPENSRRFRALPAWMTLMAYGREGYREIVQRCCGLAHDLGRWLEEEPRFELLAPVNLNIVCFALREGGTEERDAFLEHLLKDGRAYLTPTHFDGRPAIRAAFSNWRTEDEDLKIIKNALAGALGQASTSGPG